ncbi:HpcH/HpaI aldolase/citrate lyase family protein [Nitratireductor thuwali]|uniref:(3S)-malyl-CoA thioesterase n=1 Tax=Nitratireductor thuwali TaxID=2267699 RepID=A0ABY5MNZ8_9HYPH|nr:(3S)-malyl-CoA thioesterase [Nitratireductor thuwali]
MSDSPIKLRRSALYVPASNEKALAKARDLSCDAVIFDLEDSAAPEEKATARERLRKLLSSDMRPSREIIIRINPLSSEWGTEDLLAARAMRPDGILLPKVEGPDDILAADEALDEADAPPSLKLWAMMETSRSIVNAAPIAELGRNPAARLACLVAGVNDLVKETRIAPLRENLRPWLMQIVLAGRAAGIDVLAGVTNNFRDMEVFARDCSDARSMGFDGKTLIHPAQIYPANAIFAPSSEELAEARRIVEAFSKPENQEKNVVALNGRMMERLHLEQARALIRRAQAVEELEDRDD